MIHMLPSFLLAAALTACARAPAADTVRNAEVQSADGVTIRYDVYGSGEPSLVLVAGWSNPRTIWGEHVHTLSRTNRIVALDLAGHGKSDANRTGWAMDAFGEDVVAVVKQVGPDDVVLVGFSMGGAVVLEAAERLGDRVRGIVLVDAFHDPDESIPAEQAAKMEAMFRASWGDTAFLRAFAYGPDAPDSLVLWLQSLYPEAQPREHWFAALHAYMKWVNTEFRPALQRTRVPIAAINTTGMPTDLEGMRRYAPSFTLDTMAGVGHGGILHQRVADFDRKLLAIVERFEATQ